MTDKAQSTPRWVKVFGIVTLVLVLLVVVVALMIGGKHGPGRHTGARPSAPFVFATQVTHRR